MEVQGLFGSFISIIPYNITNVNGNGANEILQGTLKTIECQIPETVRSRGFDMKL